MTWVRIDDDAIDHPKFAEVSDRGFRLWVRGLCYCNKFLTDGVIPKTQVEQWPGRRTAVELVTARLWEDRVDSYEVHDYLVYQPSREQVLAEREATRKRLQRFRDRLKERNAVTNAVGNALRETALVTVSPSHPIPYKLPTEDKSSSGSLLLAGRVTEALRDLDPLLDSHDEQRVAKLLTAYPALDHYAEAVRCSDWHRDKPPKDPVRAYGNWLAKAKPPPRGDLTGSPSDHLPWLTGEAE